MLYKCPECETSSEFLGFREYYDDYAHGIYDEWGELDYRGVYSSEYHNPIRIEFICDYCDKVIATTPEEATALLG